MATVQTGIAASIGIAATLSPDEVALLVSAADVRGGGTVVASDTVGIRGDWAGPALTVTWNNILIKAGTLVLITSETTRIRAGITASADGTVDITRSSGSVADEVFVAVLSGTTA